MEQGMDVGHTPTDAKEGCPPEVLQAIIASLGGDSAGRTLSAHRAAVLHIAAALRMRPQEVAEPYCAELARLVPTASVSDFLAVLVASRVQKQLGHGSTPQDGISGTNI
jgi:hypothetical protein